jgi:hypothetical protein
VPSEQKHSLSSVGICLLQLTKLAMHTNSKVNMEQIKVLALMAFSFLENGKRPAIFPPIVKHVLQDASFF